MPMVLSGMVRDCCLLLASNEPHLLQVNTSMLIFDNLGHRGRSTYRISSVLKILYPDAVKHNNYSKTLTSVAFAGTVVGMLIFGWISDKIGRKFGMVRAHVHHQWRMAEIGIISSQMAATGIVALFSGLSAASTGAHHSATGLLAMLCACR